MGRSVLWLEEEATPDLDSLSVQGDVPVLRRAGSRSVGEEEEAGPRTTDIGRINDMGRSSGGPGGGVRGRKEEVGGSMYDLKEERRGIQY